jgi:chemotaxis signal transduction protein
VRAILLPLPEGDFALPVEVVREVAAAPPVTVLPGAPRPVLGVFNLRGEVLPVLDTMAALGSAPEGIGAGGSESGGSAAYAVVASSGSDVVALAASGLPAIVDLGEQAQSSETPGTAGSYLFQGRLVTMIDLPVLLAHAGLASDPLPAGTGTG